MHRFCVLVYTTIIIFYTKKNRLNLNLLVRTVKKIHFIYIDTHDVNDVKTKNVDEITVKDNSTKY